LFAVLSNHLIKHQDIEQNPENLEKTLANKKKSTFGMLAAIKAPTFRKVFLPKEHEAIDLIRHKQFVLNTLLPIKKFNKTTLYDTYFLKKCYSFFDYYLSVV
jgi:hypothetical protein